MDYRETEDFKALKKLSDLEKRLESDALDGKFRGMVKKSVEPIKGLMRMRFSTRIPLSDMNETIRSGTDEFASHVHARGIVLRPQEAMYHAIGREDKALYDLLSGITITDIMGMIRNKAAVSQFKCPRNMDIEEPDVPRHISRIMILRSNLPSVIRKEAMDGSAIDDIKDSFEFTTKKGETFVLGSKSVKRDFKQIEKFVNDGVIIKVIRLYHDGKKTGNLIKSASVNIKDSMYLCSLYGL